MTFTPKVWNGVLHRLQDELPPFSFEAWIEPLDARLDSGTLSIICPSSFHRERIRQQYLDVIKACLEKEASSIPEMDGAEALEIQLGVRARRAESVSRSDLDQKTASQGLSGSGMARRATLAPASQGPSQPSAVRATSLEAPKRPLPAQSGSAIASARPNGLPAKQAQLETGPAYTFENFVVGPCNALAREAAFAVAHQQQQNLAQLYLCADSGMGKTHLARAVAAEASRIGSRPVQYVSAEGFTNQFLASLRSNRTGDFKKRYRGRNQLLVVEDVQFLERKEATQLEFFHTVAHVLDTGGQVVITGDRMPAEMAQLAPRLRSQLMGGFVAELESPDAQVRRSLFRAKAAHGGWRLPQECLDRLVEGARGSVRDLEGILIQLVTTAALLKKPIDLELTETAIAQKSATRPSVAKGLSLAKIIELVSSFFKTSPDRLRGRSRAHQILIPRQVAMYLAHRYTDASTAEIARSLGRDHPAVRNAIQKIERGILEKPKLRYQIEALVERIEQSHL
ncbi:chromosomal replication initiator protein DnaA [Myxococcota bacterium]|nr:chromosomal replication initiator protein DnaA [Myxococcota bacterium]